jgi:myxalamid-type polyketide synthase MxaB
VVERVGANVTDLAVGNPVIATFTPGSLASHVTLPAKFVFAKPESLDWAEAAALPTAWFTVWHGLDQLARLRPGERVLIHAAAGGVGSAAVRHALSLGAEVIATAHPRKWSYLRDLGVRRIASSRDASFADQVLAWTEGRGVDVVLNALSDQLARRSLEVTATGGRFIDMGRMSGLDAERARELRPDVEYHAFDLGLLAARDSQQIDALLERFADSAASLRLPTRAYPIAEAERAFRDLQAGRHVAKLALTQPALRMDEPVAIRADATYLITGGTGGLGLRVAAWLAEQGATHVVLLARHAPDAQARDFIATLRESGLTVRLLEADVSDRDSVAAALAQVRSDGRALRGIIHAAGVLDDAMVEKLDRHRLRTVLDPKVRGALHLDALTRNDPLDFFVLFSSVAALLGSPGQANHAAANAFLDAFAWHRRASGRPAISLDWGVWAEIGAAARKQAGERMRLVGLGEIDPARGIDILARALAEAPVQLGVAPIDWSRFHHPLAGRGFFSRLERQTLSLVSTTAGPVLDLAGLDGEERYQALDRHLRSHIAVVLGLDLPDEIEPRSRLMDLGMDSLMAVELKQRLEHTLGCSLRTTLMYDHPTMEALIDHLSTQLGHEVGDAPGGSSARPERMGGSKPAGREISDVSDARAAGLRAGTLPETLDGFDDIEGLSDAEVLERLRR